MEYLEFIETPLFTKQRAELLTEDEYQEFQKELIINPSVGAIMRETGGCRKVRFATGNKGKSGGVRVIYYWQEPNGRIWLFTVYPKNQKDNLSSSEKNQLKAAVGMIKGGQL
ncbi:type II toxin-antitoxin system RelE/ParE family toxin [Salmonella enterica subsp. enterica serovar Infantis]|uniref:type II toxin-antitoxin system RelE/ParE family toxin n=1 Tax=Enterobacteriaceae TaxID=543 RepID=UPI0004B5B5FD|nr:MULTISPECIES: type II toxin-antitoxin system RelE/ParE family toxin [Enterobacteriaceae]EBO8631121.1 addiction module toxin RelE [Salmonella enterica subsp. enterica serovar Infantis]EBU3941494.1 addiction module toxin RelE [Salmonella enterica subsp. enterica serovar Cerro]ECT1760981.1 addiction module toxin RelE [Salmonella enterica subsp. enterica serovar Heidelberg]ECY8140100.1 addiction module toxin RelE [Salmonella enterica subsp. enterica serovar Newport]EDJ5190916.1 addiction module